MNSLENEILTNYNDSIWIFIFIDLIVLMGVLFSMSVLSEHFMIRMNYILSKLQHVCILSRKNINYPNIHRATFLH
jgi:hypothetical protein